MKKTSKRRRKQIANSIKRLEKAAKRNQLSTNKIRVQTLFLHCTLSLKLEKIELKNKKFRKTL